MDRITTATMKGVVIYAFNNDRIDYWRQAVWCADRVNRYLDLPVTIITNPDSQQGRDCTHDIVNVPARSGGIRLYDHKNDVKGHVWYNNNRRQSYELSPYQQTLVIDSDYIVCSDQLLTLFNSGISVTAMKNVYDVTDRDQFRSYQKISARRGLHHYWATVLYFDRGSMARDFFELMSMISDNYNHYSCIYDMPSHPFRNDFAVSIALNTLYGHVPDAIPQIPWAMANVFSDVDIQQISHDVFDISYARGNQPRRTRISAQDFHFMNKIALGKICAV
jgi:hypothetical protein